MDITIIIQVFNDNVREIFLSLTIIIILLSIKGMFKLFYRSKEYLEKEKKRDLFIDNLLLTREYDNKTKLEILKKII